MVEPSRFAADLAGSLTLLTSSSIPERMSRKLTCLFLWFTNRWQT